MKYTVNPNLVESLLMPLAGDADNDEQTNLFASLDVNNEFEMKEVIRKYLLPDFNQSSKVYQDQTKLSLAYFLITEKLDFERIMQSLLLPFDPSHHGKKWFVWIWEVLFNEEECSLPDTSKYKVVNDIYEPIRLKMKK
jgi:hypothetical protein